MKTTIVATAAATITTTTTSTSIITKFKITNKQINF